MSGNQESSLSERSPLLHTSNPATSGRLVSAAVPRLYSPRSVVLLISFSISVAMFGASLMTAPQLRVYENIICHHYYDKVTGESHMALTRDIDESLCKLDEIQEELAIIVGGMSVADCFPSLLFAFPYGVLGDRIGRKQVFVLAMTGVILSQFWIMTVCWFWKTFPLRLVWIAPLFQIIGGGGAVLQSTIYALISDVSNNANRANHFFWPGCGVMVAGFFSPAIASSLMRRSPWIPLLAGLGILIFSGMFVIFVPETLNRKPINGSIEPVSEILGFSSSPSSLSTSQTAYSLSPKLRKNFVNTWETLQAYASKPLVLLLTTFLIHLLGSQLIELLLRYFSKRFSWSLAQTSFILSLRALINIVLFLVILPGISYILTSSPKTKDSITCFRFNLSTSTKDLALARISLIIQIAGAFFLALSAFPFFIGGSHQETILAAVLAITGLVVYTLGMGFHGLCRSLITTLVDQQHVARLYAVISIIDTLGSSITALGLAWLYSLGMRLSRKSEANGYLGLPFWGTMLITALAGGGVMWFRMPERKADESTTAGESRTVVGNTHSEST